MSSFWGWKSEDEGGIKVILFEQQLNELPMPKMGKVGEDSWWEGLENRTSNFIHVNLKFPFRCQSGDVEQIVRYRRGDLKEAIVARDKNLKIIHVEIIFTVKGLSESS